MPFVRRKRGQVLLVHSQRDSDSSRVRQRELHRFKSASELEDALTPTGWRRWKGAMAWREPEIEFDWPSIRERLTEELERWSAAPSGAKHRRNQKVERLAAELGAELASLSAAKAPDVALLESARPSLVALQESITRLLPELHRPAVQPPSNETSRYIQILDTSRADEIFDEGMEHWWAGDRRRAARCFRRTLKLDPAHADAHNHLGIISLEARKLKAAEEHFRAAIDGGERHLEREGSEVPWGFIENRPYLRGLANLALVLGERKKWPEALAIHRQLLKLDPSDPQGVRFLIGPEYLRVGDTEGAIRVLERYQHEEVGCAFGLALAKIQARGPTADIGEALLAGFAANRYVAPMLLGDDWERLDAFHGTNMAEPEWAQDVVDAQADLWHAVPRGADLLRFWWTAPPVARWRSKLDDIMRRLGTLPMGNERTAVIAEDRSLRSETTSRELVETVRSLS